MKHTNNRITRYIKAVAFGKDGKFTSDVAEAKDTD